MGVNSNLYEITVKHPNGETEKQTMSIEEDEPSLDYAAADARGFILSAFGRDSILYSITYIGPHYHVGKD